MPELEKSVDNIVAGDTGDPSGEAARLADAIQACDRLCLLSVRTILRSAVPPVGKDADREPRTYIPGLCHDLYDLAVENAEWPDLARPVAWYPTTSAHCISALQMLVPVVERFQLGTQQSKDLAFHPIERDALEAFRPTRLPDEIRGQIDKGLQGFLKEGIVKVYQLAGASRDPSDEDVIARCFDSTTFGPMHPFTAAQILRAVAPAGGLFGPVWWRSLFLVLWFLYRRSSSSRAHPNTQATASPGTAYLTHKCVAAVETAYNVLERRWQRFTRLLKLARELSETQKLLGSVATLDRYLDPKMFSPGFRYRENILIREIRATLDEIATDTGVGIYQKWNDYIKKSENLKFLDDLVDGFVQAIPADAVAGAAALVASNNAALDGVCRLVERVAAEDKDLAADWPPAGLPPWLCSDNYWKATKALLLEDRGAAAANTKSAEERLAANLRTHWRRHRDATAAAFATMSAVGKYYTEIMRRFAEAAHQISTNPHADKFAVFLEKLDAAANEIPRLHQQMRRAIDTGIWWADTVMNRHLTYAESGAATLFDPSELAHAVRIVCRDGRRARLNAILSALRCVCSSQLADGNWPCRQPIHWTDTGHTVPTISIETALAVVGSVTELVRNPETFGAGAQEIAAGLQPVYLAIDRFFRCLAGSMQSVTVPPALGGDRELPLYGWCSDRVFEPGKIQSWVTAYAVEFLVEYRRLLQERINSSLRAQFLSFHPGELIPLSQVAPTDLGKMIRSEAGEPVIAERLMIHLRDHKVLEFAEGPWLPQKPERQPISFYSAILFGPPGSSKTFLAKAIAGELRWPLISLSPADFLAGGQDQVEARARDIFDALAAGSRLVYFFDEIDELIRDRDQTSDGQRSVFSFLTPSFLTKLQDLRDKAKQNEFIFILGTNYLDNIDSAAKRSGRIDEQLAVVYPDEAARANIFMQGLLKEPALDACLARWQSSMDELIPGPNRGKLLDVIASFSGFLSYSKLEQLSKQLQWILKVTIDGKPMSDTMELLIRTLSDEDALEARQLQRGSGSDADKVGAIVKRVLSHILRELYFLQIDDPRARYKPEVRLEEYATRPEAIREIQLVSQVIPEARFPWKWNEGSGAWEAWQASDTKEALRLKELCTLQKSVKRLKERYARIGLERFEGEIAALVTGAGGPCSSGDGGGPAAVPPPLPA